MNKDRLYLESIRECLERIEEYAAADEDAFMNSRLIQDGVIRNLELIGEATKNLSADLRAANPEIPWRQIAGMRDVLIHDYLRVNLARVWNTVDTDLPALRATVFRLLDSWRLICTRLPALAPPTNPAGSTKRRPPPKTAQPGETESPVSRAERFGVMGRHPSATPPPLRRPPQTKFCRCCGPTTKAGKPGSRIASSSGTPNSGSRNGSEFSCLESDFMHDEY